VTAATQTIWAGLVATTLADAGVTRCVVSPGSRSTPLVVALAREPRLELVTLIDERAAAFFALGAARATGLPVALVCTSGTAAAHYLPAIVEASMADVPLIAITADRPPELHGCGASQTIDQIEIYGGFVRGAIDLGAPTGGALALRAVRRKLVQAITLARGPRPGPVHLELPLGKPLEPAAPGNDGERALARLASELAGPIRIAAPRLAPDAGAIGELAAVIATTPDGVIVAGALPAGFAAARAAVFGLAARTGYPILAEAGSQLRFTPRPDSVVVVDHLDAIPADALPVPRVVIQLGAEPVATVWPAWLARLTAAGCARYVLAGHAWHDAESSARAVILGDVATAIEGLIAGLGAGSPHASDAAAGWRAVEVRARRSLELALDGHPRSEATLLRAAIAALPERAALQLGNSLPIRVVDWVCRGGGPARPVLTQRGAAGIDGLIASAAGATWAGLPVLLVLGDVSFAHDLGGLLAARSARAPLAILVIDNAGGQIFAGMPIARAQLGAAFERHWVTPPGLDPAAIARALGLTATAVASPAAAGAAIAQALATPGATVIHAPVSASGAHDVRRAALDTFDMPSPLRAAHGGSHA
jgi:2-succinyl-5-enolpyruvyl-6-hydroxy-3-cyclohexene-1-carboxylate synthase